MVLNTFKYRTQLVLAFGFQPICYKYAIFPFEFIKVWCLCRLHHDLSRNMTLRLVFKFPTPYGWWSPEITQPCPQVFSINGSITWDGLHFWCHFDVNLMSLIQMTKFFLNLVNSCWLRWIMSVVSTIQKQGNILNE